jgi:hypothetical protein
VCGIAQTFLIQGEIAARMSFFSSVPGGECHCFVSLAGHVCAFSVSRALANNGGRRTLLTSSAGLENAKQVVTAYKTGKLRDMTPELWQAKKIIDSTIHPGTSSRIKNS